MGLSLTLSIITLWMSQVTANAVPASSVTPRPQLLRKQNDNRFLGYLTYQGTFTSQDCDSVATYYQSGNYAGCCSTISEGCKFPVGCVSGSLVYTYPTGTIPSTTIACSRLYTDPRYTGYTACGTAFIYENLEDSDPLTDIFCGTASVNWSYYRAIPTSTRSSTSSSTPEPSSTPTSIASSTSPPDPTQSPQKEGSGSKAWIAGVVIGPLALITLAVLGTWFLLLKRRQAKQAQAQPQPQPTYPDGQAPPGVYYPGPGPQSPPMQQVNPAMQYAPYAQGQQGAYEQKPDGQNVAVRPVAGETAFSAELDAGQVPPARGS